MSVAATEPPKDWRMVRFGDVVENINCVERNPLGAGLERFVGLEHMDGENLHIRRWGLIDGSDTTFTKLFRKGHVLFGKRRAYQRKVAVAEFDGICSSDILTFEPKGDALIQELLPFIVQSDGFFEHALGTSSGSLSPRTRWSQLADYEFPLPPKDEQRRVADILWAADEVVERWRVVADRIGQLGMTLSLDVFRDGHRRTKVARIPDVCDYITVGIVVKPASWYTDSGGVPALRSLNVFPDRFDLSTLVHLTDEGHRFHAKSELREGDVVVVRTGRPGDAAVVTPEVAGFNAIDLIICRPKPELDPEFFSRFLNSAAGRSQMVRGTAGTAQQHFNVSAMRRVIIPVLPLSEQRDAVEELLAVDQRHLSVQKHIEAAVALRTRLLNQAMVGGIHVQ